MFTIPVFVFTLVIFLSIIMATVRLLIDINVDIKPEYLITIDLKKFINPYPNVIKFSIIVFCGIGIYFLLVSAIKTMDSLKRIIVTILLSAIVISIIGIIEHITGFDFFMNIPDFPFASKVKTVGLPEIYSNVRSTFINPNILGSYMIFPLALSISLLLSSRRYVRILAGVASLLFLHSLFFSTARAAWFGDMVSIICVGILYFKEKDFGLSGLSGLYCRPFAAPSLRSGLRLRASFGLFRSFFSGSTLTLIARLSVIPLAVLLFSSHYSNHARETLPPQHLPNATSEQAEINSRQQEIVNKSARETLPLQHLLNATSEQATISSMKQEIVNKSARETLPLQHLLGATSEQATIYSMKQEIVNRRIPNFKDAIDVWKSNPIFGVGIGNYQYYNSPRRVSGFENPHNYYLWLLAELGVVGFLAFMWIVYRIVISFSYIGSIEDRDWRYLVGGVWAGLIGFLFANTGDHTIMFLPTQLVFWTFVAILEVSLYIREKLMVNNVSLT